MSMNWFTVLKSKTERGPELTLADLSVLSLLVLQAYDSSGGEMKCMATSGFGDYSGLFRVHSGNLLWDLQNFYSCIPSPKPLSGSLDFHWDKPFRNSTGLKFTFSWEPFGFTVQPWKMEPEHQEIARGWQSGLGREEHPNLAGNWSPRV